MTSWQKHYNEKFTVDREDDLIVKKYAKKCSLYLIIACVRGLLLTKKFFSHLFLLFFSRCFPWQVVLPLVWWGGCPGSFHVESGRRCCRGRSWQRPWPCSGSGGQYQSIIQGLIPTCPARFLFSLLYSSLMLVIFPFSSLWLFFKKLYTHRWELEDRGCYTRVTYLHYIISIGFQGSIFWRVFLVLVPLYWRTVI